MKAWQLDKLGGQLSFNEIPIPEVRAGSVLVKISVAALMSYQKDYVAGKLPVYHAPKKTYTLGANGIGTIEAVGKDVWHLHAGQRVIISSHLTAGENVAEPAQMLLGVTAVGPVAEAMQEDWPDGTFAEYALVPKEVVTPIADLPEIRDEQLITVMRYIVPLGGLLRGRLSAGETIVINGATGAYGYAAVQLALAMGAGRVVAAGRNRKKLALFSELNDNRIVPIELTGDLEADLRQLREACMGGSQMAFDMVGNANNASSTLAVLRSMQRNGRMVLMGSMSVPLTISYGEMMLNNWEIMGQFMYPGDAYLHLFRLIRAGLLHIENIEPVVFPLNDFELAMDAAATAIHNQCVILKM